MSTIRMDSLLPGLVARRWVTGAFVEVGVGGTWAFAVRPFRARQDSRSGRVDVLFPNKRRKFHGDRQIVGPHSRKCLRAMGCRGADRARCAATALLLRGQPTWRLQRPVQQIDHWPAARIRCRETLREPCQWRRRRSWHRGSPANLRTASLRAIGAGMRWLAVSRVRRPTMVCSSAIRGHRREPDRLAQDGIRTETD